LKALINKYLHKHTQQIYVCFIDLQKAFDLSLRTGLLCKFGKLGIGKNIFNIIKNQFENILGSFKYQNMQSIFFCINKGVRQTDAINPTLFSIFINDIGKIFEQNCNDPLELTESQHRYSSLCR
jgi:hypothetical protein